MILWLFIILFFLALGYGCSDDEFTKAYKDAKKAERTYKENRMDGK